MPTPNLSDIVDKQSYMSYHYGVPAIGYLYRLVYFARVCRGGLAERPNHERELLQPVWR